MSPGTTKTAIDYADGNWHRLHRLTPVLQGGLFVAAIIGVILATFWDLLITVVSSLIVLQELPEDPTGDLPEIPPLGQLAIFFLVAAIGFALGALWLWLSWLLHSFRITDDVIEVRSGVFVRTYRKARRDRINSVSIWRQLVPRLIGLAKVEFQAVGSDANVTLAYLPDEVSKALRRLVLDTSPVFDQAGHETAGEVHPAVESDDFDLFTTEDGDVKVIVPLGRLAWSLVVSVETVWFLVFIALIAASYAGTGDRTFWLAVIPAVIIYLAGIFRNWTRANRFRLATVGDSIRVSYGLLSTTAETLPPRRIHSITLSQPFPWRLFGWWRIHARRAVTPGQTTRQGPSHTLLLPVGTFDDALAVVDLFVTEAVGTSGRAAIGRALHSAVDRINPTGIEPHTAIHSSPRARLRLVFSQPVHSAGIINKSLWLRTGFFTRRLTIVPLERIQSSGIFRGPWHLLLGLAGIEVHLVSGPGLSKMVGFSMAEAEYFSERLAELTVEAVGRARHRDLREGNSL